MHDEFRTGDDLLWSLRHDPRHVQVAAWARWLLSVRHPDGLLPIDMAIAARADRIDWGYWQDTNAVQEIVELSPREADRGVMLPHYVLKRERSE